MKQFNTNFSEIFDVDHKTGTVKIKGTNTVVPSLRYDKNSGEIRSYGIKSLEKRSLPVEGDVEDYLSEIPEEVIELEDDTLPDRETIIEVNGKLTDWDGSDILKTVDHHTNYRVSTLGYVMNSRGMIMSSSSINKGNHQAVCLCEGGKKQMYQVHRLVADAFIPNPDNLPVVHHIDGNPLNNRVDNLMRISKEDHLKLHEEDRVKAVKAKWEDPEYRERHRAATKEAFSMTVEMCNPDTMEVIQTFPSVIEAVRITGFSLGAISMACRGIYYGKHIYKNFYWRYKQD